MRSGYARQDFGHSFGFGAFFEGIQEFTEKTHYSVSLFTAFPFREKAVPLFIGLPHISWLLFIMTFREKVTDIYKTSGGAVWFSKKPDIYAKKRTWHPPICVMQVFLMDGWNVRSRGCQQDARSLRSVASSGSAITSFPSGSMMNDLSPLSIRKASQRRWIYSLEFTLVCELSRRLSRVTISFISGSLRSKFTDNTSTLVCLPRE